jgi:hypothetical protein
MTPQYSIPGTGMLKIERLNPDQIATNTRIGGKRVLLKGRARARSRGPES